VENHEEKSLFGIPRQRQKNNIKINLKAVECEGVEWIK
jgi:hypothetical protein